MRESKTKEIQGTKYTVTQLGALMGRKVLTRLAKHGGSIGNLPEEDAEWIYDTFAKSTTVDLAGGKQPQLDTIFDVHFAGNYQAMGEWMKFCMEFNFKSDVDNEAFLDQPEAK